VYAYNESNLETIEAFLCPPFKPEYRKVDYADDRSDVKLI